ncbi:hypothetical protein LCGC14_2938960, partial [marine sediment metagenome]
PPMRRHMIGDAQPPARLEGPRMEGVANVSILIALGAGLLSFLSPCVLPLFPSYLSLITGTSLTELEAPQDKQRVRRAVIGNSLAFIAGFSAIFIALGASFSLVGRMLLIYQDYLRIAGGILIIAFGIIITGMVKIPALARYYQPSFGDNPTGLIGTGLVGATFAIGWTPCVGPILGAILLLASTEETVRALLSRKDKEVSSSITPAKLYTHNEDVDGINKRELDNIDSEKKEYVMNVKEGRM